MTHKDIIFKIKENTFTLEKFKDGWICIYGIISGQLVQERYLYYTIQQAKRLFKRKHQPS
jgi:hypothetical protein